MWPRKTEIVHGVHSYMQHAQMKNACRLSHASYIAITIRMWYTMMMMMMTMLVRNPHRPFHSSSNLWQAHAASERTRTANGTEIQLS